MARAIAVAGAAVLGIIAVIIGLVVAAVAIILAFYDSDDLKHLAAGAASTALGREVAINGDADLDLGWVTRIRVNDLTIANADWAKARDPNMAEIAQLDSRLTSGSCYAGAFWFPKSISSARASAREERRGRGELAVCDRRESGRARCEPDAASRKYRSFSSSTWTTATSSTTMQR